MSFTTMSDPNPSGERPRSRPQTVTVTGVTGEHTHVDTANTAGIIDNRTTIHQDPDTGATLKLDLKKFENILKAHKKNMCDKESEIQKLEDDLKQQQDSVTTESTTNVQEKIRQLKEECKTHQSEIERLETEVLPDLEARLCQAQEQLAKHEQTTQDKMKDIPGLKKEIETLTGDLKQYGAEVTRERKKVADLYDQINQLEKDNRKHQEAMAGKMEKDAGALRDIQAEQARQKQQFEDIKEDFQSQTQKQQDEMEKMKADQIKLEQQHKDEKEAADRKIQELMERDAMHEKTIRDLTEPKQTASIDPIHDQSQRERVPRLPVTTQKPTSQATPSPATCDDLHDAILTGNLEEVRRILSTNNGLLNCRGEDSRTPVMRAAWEGHRGVVEFLVSRGADVSLVDGGGDTLLHLACRRGHVETVKFVLSLPGVDNNARNNRGKTAAHWARVYGRQEVVKLLVSHGAQ